MQPNNKTGERNSDQTHPIRFKGVVWMENEKEDDFTFCQVSAHIGQNDFDEQTVVPGISNITINEESSNSDSVDQINLWNSKSPPISTTLKEEKVGSLTFNVISTTQKQDSNPPKQPGNSLKDPALQKPAARAKVPFEKGYSQVDWLKLTRTHPDLAGLNGQSNRRLISMSEVKQHRTEGSMWTVLQGRVYNISPYMKFHPGGVDMLMKAVGKDCTSLFNKYHAWVNADFLLEKCLVGILDESNGGK